MRSLRILAVLIFALAASVVVCSNACATPSAEFTYTETALGGGSWQYAYTLSNTSDPVLDFGVDLYDISFTYDPLATLTIDALPTGWDYNLGTGFAELFSTIPGALPLGSDIGPGMLLSGFVFQFDYQAGVLPFDVTLVNLADPDNPFILNGSSAPSGGTPVPEPASIILLGSGLTSLALLRKKREK